MQISRAIELLVLGLSAMSVAEATFIDVNLVGRVVKELQGRQDETAKTDAGATTGTPPLKTTETPAQTTSSSETTLSTSTTQGKPPATTTSATSSSSSSSSKTGPSSTSAPASSTEPPSSSTTQSSESLKVETTTKVITTTNADGSQVTYTSESLSTATPGLASSGSGQASGMTTQTRNTVIGVVVGVGGAIILGGLALVAWRIWGRKKHQEENDGLMDYGSTAEKPETAGGSMATRTPFQSTLESYHAPTQVNTAANF